MPGIPSGKGLMKVYPISILHPFSALLTFHPLDITGEELKYLRDIAEQEAINRFTTAEISIEQTNHNTIKNGMDLDGIMSGMTDMVNEAIDISTEGVHD